MANSTENLALVLDWVDAVNERDLEKVLRLAAEDVEVIGPRGAARGHAILRAWIGRSGIRLRTLREIADGDTIVLEQEAEWPGDTEKAIVATRFTVTGGLIVRIARFDSLDAALTMES